jgi:hypothetical protein
VDESATLPKFGRADAYLCRHPLWVAVRVRGRVATFQPDLVRPAITEIDEVESGNSVLRRVGNVVTMSGFL